MIRRQPDNAMATLSRGIMLEGASCAGKTSTIYALKRRFAADESLERSIVMLGEHYTQALNRIRGQLRYHDREEHLAMLCDRAAMLEQLNAWAQSLGEHSRRSRGLYTVLERALINHIAHYQDGSDPRVVALSERFASLGIEAVLLVVSPERMAERVQLRQTQLHADASPARLRQLTEAFARSQESLLAALERTPLPGRVICTDEMDWDAYARQMLS
ncbi:MAG: hypothetical protein ACOYJA_08245 [Christensenellales bacterium]|jgi:thymidylate kinase